MVGNPVTGRMQKEFQSGTNRYGLGFFPEVSHLQQTSGLI
jgi:hypothetical protein